jgi:hypothetical protein
MESQEANAAAYNLIDQFGPFVSVLLFVSGDGSRPAQVTNNATASFINTGTKKLVVTCAHVVEEFRAKRQADPTLWMALGFPGPANKVVVVPEEQLIECGRRETVDLASFSLREPDVITEFGKQYFPCSSWPPPRPSTRGVLGIVGFPGELREVTDEGLRTRLNGLAINIDSVSDRCTTSVDVDMSRFVVKLDDRLGELGTLAGMSGSAAYDLAEDTQPQLAGFLYEAGEHGGVHLPLRIMHADFLKSDGTLDWARVSW